MKRIRIKRTQSNAFPLLLFRSTWVFILALFFLAAGISCGAFTETLMTSGQKTALTEYLSSYLSFKGLAASDYQDIFINSLQSNLLLLIIMALPCLTGFGFPLAFAVLAYKGAAIGFSSALLIENMAQKGAALTFVSMAPQNLIILPAMYTAAVICTNLAFLILTGGLAQIKSTLASFAGTYGKMIGILALALAFGALVEASLSPALTRLIM